MVPAFTSLGELAAIGRFNRDAALDVCLAVGDGVNAMAGLGTGDFAGPFASQLGGLGFGPATVADFDGDGRSDLLLLRDYQGATLLLNVTP